MANMVALTMGELDRLQVITRIAERRLTRRRAATLRGARDHELRALRGRTAATRAGARGGCDPEKAFLPYGGPRTAGAASPASVESPRCVRIRWITAGSSIVARTVIRPPHLGHDRTSTLLS